MKRKPKHSNESQDVTEGYGRLLDSIKVIDFFGDHPVGKKDIHISIWQLSRYRYLMLQRYDLTYRIQETYQLVEKSGNKAR